MSIVYDVRCDFCGRREGLTFFDLGSVARHIKQSGWQVRGSRDICEICDIDQRLKLAGIARDRRTETLTHPSDRTEP